MIIEEFQLNHKLNVESFRRIGSEMTEFLVPQYQEISVYVIMRTLDVTELDFVKYDIRSPSGIDYWPEHDINRKQYRDTKQVKPLTIKYGNCAYTIDQYQTNIEWDHHKGYSIEIKGLIKPTADLPKLIV